ncbi:MAG: Immunity protein 26 [Pseudomonadota bacterium]
MAKGLVSGGKKKIRYAPKQGDVIAIKIRPKTFVLAKVAYVSEYHRGVLFFRVYNEVFPSAEAPAKLPSQYRGQFQSFVAYIQSGRWQVVGHDPVTKGDKEASRYVTASGLFERDKRLRDVRDSDREKILPLIIHSYASAEKLLREGFGV